MRTLILIVLSCIYSSLLCAQPGEKEHHFINRKAYTENFIHFAIDSVHLAQYATEANQVGFEIQDSILCKLKIPLGLTKMLKSCYKKHHLQMTEPQELQLRFHFYIDGNPMGSCTYIYPKEMLLQSTFEVIYKLSKVKSDPTINLAYAYFQSVKDLGTGPHRISLIAQILLPHGDKILSETIASGGFVLMIKKEAMDRWKQEHGLSISNPYLPTNLFPPHPAIDAHGGNLNPLLESMADSAMKALFGADGLNRWFIRTCLKNPCDYMSLYGVNQVPCDTNAISRCGEAVVIYQYRKADVPLFVEIKSTITHLGRYVLIKDNNYGFKQVPQERLSLLSVQEMNERIQEQFPNDSLVVRNFNNQILVYSMGRLYTNPVKHGKFKHDSGSVIEEETAEGEAWTGGFLYTAYSKDVNAKPYIYYFDATNGNYLMKVGFQNVTEEYK